MMDILTDIDVRFVSLEGSRQSSDCLGFIWAEDSLYRVLAS